MNAKQEPLKTTEEKVGNINWQDFGGQYITLEEAQPIVLQLTDWKQISRTYDGQERTGLSFRVMTQNGIPQNNKEFVSTSKRLCLALRPFIEGAEANNRFNICVKITKVGQGKNTQYNVKEVL